MISPHGGTLVDRVAADDSVDGLRASVDGPRIELSEETFRDAVNVAIGRYSPLTGFLTENDFRKVVEDLALEDGTIWPLPTILDVPESVANEMGAGTRASLVAPDGREVGVIDVEDVYTFDPETAARRVFGTADSAHAGARSLRERDPCLVGGDVLLFEAYRGHELELHPAETRVLFDHRGWRTVAGFQTRNVPHRAHEHLQKTSLETVDGLLVQPRFGQKKPGDYADDTILQAYETLVEHYYPDGTVVLSPFSCSMRYAGPREAVFDALVRKNHGCTHFIVGRDHAGVGDFYEETAAHDIFDELPDLGIEPLCFDSVFYCQRCDGMASVSTCCHAEHYRAHPSGTEIREAIEKDSALPSEVIRPEVADRVTEKELSLTRTPSEGTE